MLDYHICNAKELDRFGTPTAASTAIKYYKGDASGKGKKHLFCIDRENFEEGELSVWGVENAESYQRFEVILLPCNYIHIEFDSTNEAVHE